MNVLRFVYFVLYLFFRIFCKFHKPYKAQLPIISVGNILVGGTGKTPFVSWLIGFLKQEGFSPIVLTRGYRSVGKGIRVLTNIQDKKTEVNVYGDEAAMLSMLHRTTPIIVSANRIASLKKYSFLGDIAILDDGMQQLKIKKDLDIGLVDALVGFGNKKLIPQGRLREPMRELQRNDFFLLSRCNLQKNKQQLTSITTELPKDKTYYKLNLHANSLVSSKNLQNYSIQKLRNQNVVLFSGISNPQGFKFLVKFFLGPKGRILQTYNFCDHFQYTKKDLERIFAMEYLTKALFLTTEKDLVKLFYFQDILPEFFILQTKLELPVGLIRHLRKFLKQHKNKKI